MDDPARGAGAPLPCPPTNCVGEGEFDGFPSGGLTRSYQILKNNGSYAEGAEDAEESLRALRVRLFLLMSMRD